MSFFIFPINSKVIFFSIFILNIFPKTNSYRNRECGEYFSHSHIYFSIIEVNLINGLINMWIYTFATSIKMG